MNISQRPFSGETDLKAMAALANRFPAENMHVADLPYRFSSWALDFPENIGLWVGEREDLVGWAVMQTPFWTIDYAYDPAMEATLHPQILHWADERTSMAVETDNYRDEAFLLYESVGFRVDQDVLVFRKDYGVL